ncbi:helix-turn-helix domain-containing protein [Cellulomonas iranensis]|uniref:helix-turn-helix domain-containing protein n=1 Tax=Cellulomonas iranensis TaxID=76862 RepID=UPI0013D6143E|nr:helix-turn-helix domain-containing protein [Cellulomonas iranensis]
MSEYTARVELTELAATPNRLEVIVDALEGYHPAAARSLLGRIEVTISLPAAGLRQAASTAIAVVEQATGLTAVAVDVATSADHDRALGLQPVPELLSPTQVAKRLDISRQAVLQRLAARTLPGIRVGDAWAVPVSAVEKLLDSEAGLRAHRTAGDRVEDVARRTPQP